MNEFATILTRNSSQMQLREESFYRKFLELFIFMFPMTQSGDMTDKCTTDIAETSDRAGRVETGIILIVFIRRRVLSDSR